MDTVAYAIASTYQRPPTRILGTRTLAVIEPIPMSDLVDQHDILDDAKLHAIITGSETVLTRQVTLEGLRAAHARPTRARGPIDPQRPPTKSWVRGAGAFLLPSAVFG